MRLDRVWVIYRADSQPAQREARQCAKELKTLGAEVADRIGQIWGEDEAGELSNMFKRTRQPGAWFIAGSLTQARIYSKYMALQIKAMEENLIDTDPFAAKER